MPTRNARAIWSGDLKGGRGTMSLGSGAFEGAYSLATRFEDRPGTNPEELIGAAHAGCFSMALAAELGRAGHGAKRVATDAKVHLEKVDEGFAITRVALTAEADVPGIDAGEFARIAEAAKRGCPVSKALAGVDITLEARLV